MVILFCNITVFFTVLLIYTWYRCSATEQLKNLPSKNNNYGWSQSDISEVHMQRLDWFVLKSCCSCFSCQKNLTWFAQEFGVHWIYKKTGTLRRVERFGSFKFDEAFNGAVEVKVVDSMPRVLKISWNCCFISSAYVYIKKIVR